jgi:TonB family protein
MEPQLSGTPINRGSASKGHSRTGAPPKTRSSRVLRSAGKGERAGLQFALLQTSAMERRRRRRAMLCAAPFEALLFFAFFWIVAAQPPLPTTPQKEVMVVPLYMPPTTQPEPPPKPVHVRLPRPVLPAPPPKMELPKVAAVRQQTPTVQEPRFQMPKAPEPKPVAVPPAPLPKLAVVRPAGFGSGSPATPTIKRAIEKVQTGGFGNPHGLPGHAEGGSKGNVAKLGSFDLPSGPGYGNGSGGTRGARGVVASAGFGSGSTVASSGNRHGSWSVETSTFGDASSGRGTSKEGSRPETPDFVPATIISKPTPVYPPEARKLHIEGEVLLSVVFEASGQMQVLRVVRGLGHGMDEAAERAAEGIAFKPAQREGRAVDMKAVVHIIFQLAY